MTWKVGFTSKAAKQVRKPAKRERDLPVKLIMQGVEKIRHIEKEPMQMEIVFRGPGKRSQAFQVNPVLGGEVRRLLKEKIAASDMEYAADDDWIPAEGVLPELKNPVSRAAACLRGLRYRENITQRKLAAEIGILPHHLSEMEHGKRPIGKTMAKKLAAALNANWKVLL